MFATISSMPFVRGVKQLFNAGNKHRQGKTPWNKGTRGIVKAWNKGKPAPWATKRNLETNHLRRGENAYHWKGGTYGTERHRDMGRQEYKQWRSGVFKRDNWTCQTCRARGGYLEAHHIKSWKDYPELRYDVANGVTLCLPCHKLTR